MKGTKDWQWTYLVKLGQEAANRISIRGGGNELISTIKIGLNILDHTVWWTIK